MILTNQAWNLVDELIKRNHFNTKTTTTDNMKLEDDVLTWSLMYLVYLKKILALE